MSSFFFYYIDKYNLLNKYKIHHETICNVNYSTILTRVSINQICILLPTMVLLENFNIIKLNNDNIINIYTLFSLPLFSFGHDIIQYIMHRFLSHNYYLYNLLGHNIHHKINANIAISAIYMSNCDFILIIVLPYIIPLIIIGNNNNLFINILIISSGMLGGVYEHSGYDFSKIFKNKFIGNFFNNKLHFIHHKKLKVNFSNGFGSTSISDRIFKTTIKCIEE